jgi:hypothetical protein
VNRKQRTRASTQIHTHTHSTQHTAHSTHTPTHNLNDTLDVRGVAEFAVHTALGRRACRHGADTDGRPGKAGILPQAGKQAFQVLQVGAADIEEHIVHKAVLMVGAALGVLVRSGDGLYSGAGNRENVADLRRLEDGVDHAYDQQVA